MASNASAMSAPSWVIEDDWPCKPQLEETPKRRTLYDGALGKLECADLPAHSAPSGYETRYQIVLPYRGLFSYQAGGQGFLFDANRILFVRPDREFRDKHPVAGLGHGSIIISPRRHVLDEICGGPGASAHSAFEDVSRPSSPKLKLAAETLLSSGVFDKNPLAADELLVETMRGALRSARGPAMHRVRAVRRAKEYLHARGFERLRLEEIATAVGVTSIYLTQEFKRSEGMPLYRYQRALRLAQALRDLPKTDDITGLALTLGFSSHSHFSSAFRAEFGITPSQFRFKRSGSFGGGRNAKGSCGG